MLRLAAAVVALLLAAVIIAAALAGADGPSDAELAARIDAGTVEWPTYQEGIKRLVGARAAAEWSGELVRASYDDTHLRIVAALSGPWATRSVALPLLVRLPSGEVLQPTAVEALEHERLYAYARPDGASVAIPWVDIQRPGGEIRIAFRDEGTWRGDGV